MDILKKIAQLEKELGKDFIDLLKEVYEEGENYGYAAGYNPAAFPKGEFPIREFLKKRGNLPYAVGEP